VERGIARSTVAGLIPPDQFSAAVHVGAVKLPSWLPWTPNEAASPGCRLPFQLMLVAVTVVVEPSARLAFQEPVICAGSSKFSVAVQPSIAAVSLLVTKTSSW
jgi:hypothetical protein